VNILQNESGATNIKHTGSLVHSVKLQVAMILQLVLVIVTKISLDYSGTILIHGGQPLSF